MAITVASLDESVVADRAFELFLLIVCFLMIDQVTEFSRLNMAFETLENLVGAAGCRVDHVVLCEAHVAGIWTVPISDTLLDHLLGLVDRLGSHGCGTKI